MQIHGRKSSQLLSFFIFFAIFAGYRSVFAESAENKDTQHNFDWPGVYYGFLPCADCKGVKTSLALNANSSYILITEFVGKSPREFVEKGKFTWADKSKTIILTPRNSSTTRQYSVGDNALSQLDEKGNRISDSYILRRTDVIETTPKHPH